MSTNRPFIRIAATYPTTDDARLPSKVEVELDVDDAAPEEEPQPLDDEEFPSGGFTRFVTEVVRALRGGATPAEAVHVFSFGPLDVEKLERLTEHAPDCDGTCDQPPSPPPAGPADEDLPDSAPTNDVLPQPADPEPAAAAGGDAYTEPRVEIQADRNTISAYPTDGSEKGGA